MFPPVLAASDLRLVARCLALSSSLPQLLAHCTAEGPLRPKDVNDFICGFSTFDQARSIIAVHAKTVGPMPITWPARFVERCQESSNPMSPGMGHFLEPIDSFVPPALDDLLPEDLPLILRLADQACAISQRNSSYRFIPMILKKFAVLAVDRFPCAYERANDAARDTLIGAKIASPDQNALYHTCYAYILGHKHAGFFGMAGSMSRLFDEIALDSPGSLDPRLGSVLRAMDSQYIVHFLDARKAG